MMAMLCGFCCCCCWDVREQATRTRVMIGISKVSIKIYMSKMVCCVCVCAFCCTCTQDPPKLLLQHAYMFIYKHTHRRYRHARIAFSDIEMMSFHRESWKNAESPLGGDSRKRRGGGTLKALISFALTRLCDTRLSGVTKCTFRWWIVHDLRTIRKRIFTMHMHMLMRTYDASSHCVPATYGARQPTTLLRVKFASSIA